MGRRMADGGEIPWGDNPPFRAPVFVVTHRPRTMLHRQGGTSFTYVTDGIHSAIEQAREAAKGKNVAVAGGGALLRQVIALGLLDELDLHIAPVILGDGMRLLDHRLELDTLEGIELTPDRVTATDDVTHIRYRVRERLALSSQRTMTPGRSTLRVFRARRSSISKLERRPQPHLPPGAGLLNRSRREGSCSVRCG